MLPDSSILSIPTEEMIILPFRTARLRRGGALPSSANWPSVSAVSRMTARQALHLLAREGVDYSRVGKGNYASEPNIPQNCKR